MSLDATRVLSFEEYAQVVNDLRERAQRSESFQMNLVIFRLSCGCGLRRSEIAGLNVGDLSVSEGHAKPYIMVRAEIAKGKKARRVPLWWDAPTTDDLRAWKELRQREGALPRDPFIVAQQKQPNVKWNRRLSDKSIYRRWQTAIKSSLGEERAADLSVHKGRHSFCSLMLGIGKKTLTEVRDAAGHADVGTTNKYLHVIDQPDSGDALGI